MQTDARIYLENNHVFVSGEINFDTTVSLWNHSLPFFSHPEELIFDFSGVTKTNSAGLALLLEWIKYAKQAKKRIIFKNLPAQLTSVAAVAGINKLLVDYI